MRICAIVAINKLRTIGINNHLPWHIPEDMKRFSTLTRGHTVLMGRRTWDSLPEKYRPLPGRANVVATRQKLELTGALVIDNIERYIESEKLTYTNDTQKILWVIGGSEVYSATKIYWDEVYLTLVDNNIKGDAFFPTFEDQFQELACEQHPGFKFINYRRK